MAISKQEVQPNKDRIKSELSIAFLSILISNVIQFQDRKFGNYDFIFKLKLTERVKRSLLSRPNIYRKRVLAVKCSRYCHIFC